MIGTYLGILAAAQAADTPTAAPQEAPAVIEVRKADGSLAARAMVWQGRSGLEVRVQAAGLPAGHYGVHLHDVGRCDGPAFASAGGHWNPTGHQHGRLNPAGHHLGDLDNLDVDERGAGRMEFTISGVAAGAGGGLFDADGAALVIHAAPDDYRTDPSGNSGARIACGVLRAS